MTLICRIDEALVTSNFHALCRRALAAASADNQVALVVFNNVYIFHVKKTYVEVVAKIESGSADRHLSVHRSSDADLPPIQLVTPQAYRDELMQVISRACIDPYPRFVWAAWTPVAVYYKDVMKAALCTINIKNCIDLWMQAEPQENSMYAVEKICDITTHLVEQLGDETYSEIAQSGEAEQGCNRLKALRCLQTGGIAMCEFVEPPQERIKQGFLGCICKDRFVFLVWFNNNADECNNMGMEIDKMDLDASLNNRPHIQKEKLEEMLGSYRVINRKQHVVDDFDIKHLMEHFSASTTRQTSNERVSCKIVGLVNLGDCAVSMTAILRNTEKSKDLYNVFVATGMGTIKTIDIEVIYVNNGIDAVNIGKCHNVMKLMSSVEMMRIYTFYGNAVEHQIIIAISHNVVVFYDLQGGVHRQHQCGPYPLVSYRAESLFMSNGMIAKVILLDALGKSYCVTVDEDLNIHTETLDEKAQDLTPFFLQDSEITRLEAYIGGSSLELHHKLRTSNLFVMLTAIMATKRDLTPFSDVLEFSANVSEIGTIDTMFYLGEPSLEVSLSSMTQTEFMELAKTEEAFKFWRTILTMLDGQQHESKERIAMLLYLIAYIEVGGDTTERVATIHINDGCTNMIQRIVMAIEITDQYQQHLTHIVERLYAKKQLHKLLKSN